MANQRRYRTQASNDLRAGWNEEMKTRLPCLLLVGLAAVCCMICVTRAAVFSIDFGSEWIKIALVKVSTDRCWSAGSWLCDFINIYRFFFFQTAWCSYGNRSEQVSWCASSKSNSNSFNNGDENNIGHWAFPVNEMCSPLIKEQWLCLGTNSVMGAL